VSSNPDQIREEIEVTRGQLSEDVDVLTETVRPSNVARRQADKLGGRAGALKDRVMGAADDAGSVTSSVGDKASALGDKAGEAPHMVRRQTRGNPLAAGLVALGVGWLVGSLLPASEAERQAAEQLKDKAQPLVEEAKQVAQDTAQELKGPAQDAVGAVKDSAAESAQTVKEEGRSTAADVQGSARDAADTVRHSSGE
jgi:gas vesicle protein